MIVYAFVKGVCPDPFGESIIRNRPRTFAELRRQAVEHIASEREVCVKRTSSYPRAREGRRELNPPGSLRPRREGRNKRVDTPTKPESPSPGVQRKVIARPEKERGRQDTILWWN